MNTKDKVVAELRKNAERLGVNVDGKGYVSSVRDNLIEEYSSWSQIEKELNQGGGSELLTVKGQPPKFLAIHSSAALCVNSFALVKENRSVSIFGESHFHSARFEVKLPTGISMPHLDFCLENSSTTVGIESKFTEILVPKKPHNLDKYIIRRNEIACIPDDFFELIHYYIQNGDKRFLDVSQLLKHSIGLIKYSEMVKTKPKLVYIYWTPGDDGFLPLEYRQHALEVTEFSHYITKFIDFIALRYEDLWDSLAPNPMFNRHVSKLMSRYQISSESIA